jgi:hypothetical protein
VLAVHGSYFQAVRQNPADSYRHSHK